MDPIITRKSEAKNFMEGPEHCREYVKDKKLTFGTSTLPPGARGAKDPGHPNSREIFFVVQGDVLLYVEETDKYLELHTADAVLIPEGVSHTLINVGESTAVVSWSLAPSEM
jgi:mannose-6-phosphate isomerase-like protein (cupin superfamily)